MVTRSRARHGQTLVESVLGLLVFVTILMFGIYFAEVGYLSIKAQEAATAPLWDSTGGRMHALPGSWDDQKQTVRTYEANAQDRYSDFDGRTSSSGPDSVKAIYASISNLQVTCDDQVDLGFSAAEAVNGVYSAGNAAGIACSAHAEVGSGVMQIPTSFLETGERGFFQERHFTRAPFEVCGVGRNAYGACDDQKYALMLDDWALHWGQNGEEADESPLGDEGTPFYKSVKIAYDSNSMAKLRMGQMMLLRMQLFLVAFSYDEDKCWLHYRGMESDFQGSSASGEGGNPWATSPGGEDGISNDDGLSDYKNVYDQRGTCFPGVGCPSGP